MTFRIAVILLLAALILLQWCHPPGTNSTTSHSDTTYVKSKDPWHEPMIIKVPTPYLVEVHGKSGDTIRLPSIIDTMAIIEDYFTRRHYADSVKTDSIEIRWKVSCYKNKLYDQSLKYRWLAPSMVITKTVEKQLMFIGVDITGPKFGIYPSIYFDTRRGMFGGGYDFLNKQIKVGVYAKLRLWKKKG